MDRSNDFARSTDPMAGSSTSFRPDRRGNTARISALGLLLVCWLLPTAPAGAQTMLGCGLTNQPAATLLLPYFEVDLAAADRRNTLLSIGNAAAETVLTRVVVWTNWGHPVLAFDLSVPGSGLRTLDLRSILDGQLPESQPPAPTEDHYVSCSSPVTQASTDFANMRDLLLGKPRRLDGLCYAGQPEQENLVTGFVTVDVVQDCSGTQPVSPISPGYFGDCASGLAGNDNVLWGNVYRLDYSQDAAQGEQLVAVATDQRVFGTAFECVDPPCGARNDASFYRDNAQGNRMPLATEYRAQFMANGQLATDLLVWIEGTTGPAECGSTPEDGGRLSADVFNEKGLLMASTAIEGRGQAFRLHVGADALNIGFGFGVLRLQASGGDLERQFWIGPVLSAKDRFSAGLTAVPTRDLCN